MKIEMEKIKMTELVLAKKDMFGENEINIYRNESNEVFMTAKQLGEVLEYEHPDVSINRIIRRNPYLQEKEFSLKPKLQATDGKFYRTRLLNKNGIKAIISISERPIAIKRRVASAIDSEWSFLDYLTHRTEDEHIHLIQTVLKTFNPEREVVIGEYRCDLLFPDHKLIIECDEHDHKHYDKELEIRRERFIKDRGYQLFRFNPHEKDFYIGDTLGEILEILLDESNKNEKDFEEEKSCN